MAYVRLIPAAVEDLQSLADRHPQVVEWAVKKMLLLESNPEAGESLGRSLVGWRKLTVGNRDWRIVWRVTTDNHGEVTIEIAEVWAVGARSDEEIYDEMRARIAMAPSSSSVLALSEVVARLDKLSSNISVAVEPQPVEPLPDWLVKQLTVTAGFSAEEVGALTLEQAFEAWGDFRSKPR